MRLQQWTTKNKSSDLLGLQAKFDTLQTQFMALLTKRTKLKNKQQQTNKLTGAPKPEENGNRWSTAKSGTTVQNVCPAVAGTKHICQNSTNQAQDAIRGKIKIKMHHLTLDCMTLVMVRIFCLAKNDNYAITQPDITFSHNCTINLSQKYTVMDQNSTTKSFPSALP